MKLKRGTAHSRQRFQSAWVMPDVHDPEEFSLLLLPYNQDDMLSWVNNEIRSNPAYTLLFDEQRRLQIVESPAEAPRDEREKLRIMRSELYCHYLSSEVLKGWRPALGYGEEQLVYDEDTAFRILWESEEFRNMVVACAVDLAKPSEEIAQRIEKNSGPSSPGPRLVKTNNDGNAGLSAISPMDDSLISP